MLKGYKLFKQAKLEPEAKDSSFISTCVTQQWQSADLVFCLGLQMATDTAF